MSMLAQALVFENAVVLQSNSVTLTGAAPLGYVSFANAYPTGTVLPYFIVDTVTGAFEYGQGTFNSGVLERTLPQGGSAGTTLYNFVGNVCNVYSADGPPIGVSSGSSSEGRIPMLNSQGLLDASFLALVVGSNAALVAYALSLGVPSFNFSGQRNTVNLFWM